MMSPAFSPPLNAASLKRLSTSSRLVYDELRELAARRLAREKPGHTLQATAAGP